MPNLRHSSVYSPVPTQIIAILVIVAIIAAIFQRHLHTRRHKRHISYNSDSRIALNQRNEELSSYINRLKAQLVLRESQLKSNIRLTDMIREQQRAYDVQEIEWDKIMKVGENLHGENWDLKIGDELSLRELMEEHKDELMQMKLQWEASKYTKSIPSPRVSERGKRNNLKSMRELKHPIDGSNLSQWTSSRPAAPVSPRNNNPVMCSPAVTHGNVGRIHDHGERPRIPLLDFGKLKKHNALTMEYYRSTHHDFFHYD